MEKFTINACALTDIGYVRRQNEDSVYIGGQKIKIYAVCDGMGGESFGEVASKLAVQELDVLSKNLDELDETLPEFFERLDSSVDNYILSANRKICDEITVRRKSMGTTLALICTDGETAYCYNIGDSRIYLWRKNILSQISRDHTVAEEFLRAGAITPEQARTHYGRNLLTQNLGLFPEDTTLAPCKAPAIQLEGGDRLLICSDGLTDMCDDKQIGEIFGNISGCEDISKALINSAKANGGADNISAVAVCIDNI